jgi:hypothetical protein
VGHGATEQLAVARWVLLDEGEVGVERERQAFDRGGGGVGGAGALVEVEGRLEGDELIGGLPSQTRRLVVYFPAGTKIDPTGFPTCTVVKLEQDGPEGCPKQSRIADGTVGVADQIGSGEATRETGALEIFITPGNGVVAYANAVAPISGRCRSSVLVGLDRPVHEARRGGFGVFGCGAMMFPRQVFLG